LRQMVALKKKYKCYIYLDEAHSIGAMGPKGKGISDYYGVDPKDIDLCMGTFTKSFGSVGGYIAATKDIIAHLRMCAHGELYAEPMSPVCAQASLSALRILLGEQCPGEGERRIQRLHDNTRFMRQRLHEMGFMILGDDDSPVIPILVFLPGALVQFSRLLLQRNIAIVIVGFPAVPLLHSRVRLCISSSHTREDLEWALRQIDELGDLLGIKFCPRSPPAPFLSSLPPPSAEITNGTITSATMASSSSSSSSSSFVLQQQQQKKKN